MKRPRFPDFDYTEEARDKRLFAISAAPWILATWIIIMAVVLSCCSGCTQQDRAASGTGHTRSMTRAWADAAGVTTTLQETWSETAEQSKTTTGFDPVITGALASGAGIVAKAATGDWSGAIAGTMGLLVTGAAAYAANQRGKATSANQRAEEHKADAAEGWAKFQEVAVPRSPGA